MVVDECGDIGAECRDAALDPSPDPALGDEGEEALDLIEPGSAGRGELQKGSTRVRYCRGGRWLGRIGACSTRRAVLSLIPARAADAACV